MISNMKKAGYIKAADGDYIGAAVEVIREESPNGYPKYKWLVEARSCRTGKEAKITKVFTLANAKAVKFMLRELELLGVTDLNGREDIEAKKDLIVGKCFLFQAVTRDDGWQSYYIKKLITDESTKTESAEDILAKW